MKDPAHLTKLEDLLKSAQCPEDVFGPDKDDVPVRYRLLAKESHPDVNRDHRDRAEAVFKELGKWLAIAEDHISVGTYGMRKKKPKLTVAWKGGTVGLFSVLRKTPEFSYYDGELDDGTPVTVKVATTATRALIEREAKTLELLDKKYPADPKVWQPFPRVLGMFKMDIGKGVHVPALITSKPQAPVRPFTDVRDKYPDGVHVKDSAWMVNRLASLAVRCNEVGIVHGNLSPVTVSISPEHHTIFVQDWHTAVAEKGKGSGKGTGDKWDCFTPPEILKKEDLGPCTDLFSVGALGSWLLSNVVVCKYSALSPGKYVPSALRGLLVTCLLKSSKTRPYENASQFHSEWKQELETLYGKPTFRPFQL